MSGEGICLACGGEGSIVYRDCGDFLCGSPGTYTYLRCPSCQMLWASPQPSPRELDSLYRKYFNEIPHTPQFQDSNSNIRRFVRAAILTTDGYPIPGSSGRRSITRLSGRILASMPFVRTRARYGLGLLWPKFREGGRLLDVGCGMGWFVKIMRDWGWDAVGLEPDGELAQRARELYEVPILVGTLDQRPFPAGSFEVVVMRHAIEHVTNPLEYLGECRRILKPDGILAIATPNGASLASRWFRQNWFGASPPWHLNLFSPRAIEKALVATGFEPETIRTTAVSAHWVYTTSRQIRAGAFDRRSTVRSSRWFQLIEAISNRLVGDLGEELEVVARPCNSHGATVASSAVGASKLETVA